MEHKQDNVKDKIKNNKIKNTEDTVEKLLEDLESKKEEIEQLEEEIKKEIKAEKTEKRIKENKKATGKVFQTINKNLIVKYYDKFLSQKNHHLIVPIAGFFDTIFMIIPADVITIAYLIKHKQTKLLPFSLINSAATTLGTFIVYIMGYFYYEQIQNIFSSIGNFFHIHGNFSSTYLEIVDKISNSQLILTFFTSLTSTIPFALLAFIAGGLKFNILYFVIAIFLGRFLKFFTISYITKYYGPSVLKKISKNFTFFIITIIILLILKNILI